MGEYGRIVGESSGIGGGGGGDVTDRILDTLGDAVDAVASQPPEILIGVSVALLVLLVIFFRR